MQPISSRTLYGWFYLEPITKRTVTYNYEDFELTDEEYLITQTDVKFVLQMMRSGNYSFKQIYAWSKCFCDFIDRIPCESELVKAQIGYIIYEIWIAVETVLDDKEEHEAEASDLFLFIDELLEIFEQGRTDESESWNNLLLND